MQMQGKAAAQLYPKTIFCRRGVHTMQCIHLLPGDAHGLIDAFGGDDNDTVTIRH